MSTVKMDMLADCEEPMDDSVVVATEDASGDAKLTMIEDNVNSCDEHLLQPLGATYVLWYLENARNRDWKECVKEVGAFNTIQGFYTLNAGMKPPSYLRYGNDYMLFKEGVKPMWEDENNRAGGRWRMSVESRRSNNFIRTDAYWFELMLAFITGSFSDDEEILGIVVNRRAKGDKISVWTRDAENEKVKNRVGRELRKLLIIPEAEKVAYFPHEMPATIINHQSRMLIKVKTLTGKEVELDIEPNEKVSRLKEKIEEKEGIPPAQQRLIFSGKQMNDDKGVDEYRIIGGSVLHLVLALRGGF